MRFKQTSSFTESRTRRYVRRSARGAVFVEAVIVIAALTLGLIALCYVRELYVTELGVSRLARASVIAHSMAGCKANLPQDWVGRDLANFSSKGPSQEPASARGKDSAAKVNAADPRADNLVQKAGGTSSDGQGLLNPITNSEFSGTARASASAGGGARAKSRFVGQLRAKSYVSCGDEVKDGDFDRVLGVMKDELSTLLGH
jgi:hypothetical protein